MATRKTAAAKRAEAPDPFAPPPAQAELTPGAAPATAAANDAARQAIATINTQLSEFDKVEAGIAELERKYKGVVYAVDTPKGMKEAVAARLDIRTPRFALEDARKAAKAPVLDLGRDIDAHAAKIKPRLMALETPIHEQIQAQETKEALRKAALQERIVAIEAKPRECIGKSSEHVQTVLTELEAIDLATFQEFREHAAKAQYAAVTSVKQLLQQAKDSQEVLRLRAEQLQATQRREQLQQRVDAIGDVLALPFRFSQRVASAIAKLTGFEVGEDFAEFAPAAREKKTQVLAALEQKRADLVRAEEAAEQRKPIPVAVAAAPEPRPDPAPTPAPGREPQEDPHPMAASPAPRGSAQDPMANPFTDEGEGGTESMSADLVDWKTGHTPADHTAQRRAYGYIFGGGGGGRRREVDAPPPPAAAPVDISDMTEVPDPNVVDAEVVHDRPKGTDILVLVASHYSVSWGEAARWLREIDFGEALTDLTRPS